MTNEKAIYFELKKKQPHAKIHVKKELEQHFDTQQRVFLSASEPHSNTIELVIHFQTFSGTLEIETSFLLPEEHNHDYLLLHTLTQCSSLPITIDSSDRAFHPKYNATIPIDTRIGIKRFLGELHYYNDLNNLKETIMSLSQGFSVPYTNQDVFQLLMKIDEKLFETLFLADTESIHLTTYIEQQLLVLAVMYHETCLGSIRFSKDQICDDILDDFEVLLSTNRVSFVLASDNQQRRYYLCLKDSLKEADVTRITRFLFTGMNQQHNFS